jgi:hypothetical protein
MKGGDIKGTNCNVTCSDHELKSTGEPPYFDFSPPKRYSFWQADCFMHDFSSHRVSDECPYKKRELLAQARALSEKLSSLTRLQYQGPFKVLLPRLSKEEADAYDECRRCIAGICDMLRPPKTR